jgi:hypothetical protein
MSYPAGRISTVTSSPPGAVLLDDDGILHPVEPAEHLVRCVDGHLVCVRPAHEGMECRVELAA